MRTTMLALVIPLAAAITAGAFGRLPCQDALGAGDVLDANLSVRGTRNLPAPVPDYRLRNLLITGNVAAGRGFRGTVGYVADVDFRGRAGSEDLDLFRADSALSTVAFISSDSTYTRLRMGQDLGLIEFRRSGSAAAPGSFAASGLQRGPTTDLRLRLDRLSQAASLVPMAQMRSEPQVIGWTRTREQQPVRVTASALTGVSGTPAAGDPRVLGLTSFDLARLIEDHQAGLDVSDVGRPFQRRAQEVPELGPSEPAQATTETRTSLGSEPIQTRGEPARFGDYDRILTQVADRYAAARKVDLEVDRSVLADLDDELDELRERLAGLASPAAGTAAGTDEDQVPGAGIAPERPPVPAGIVLKHGQRIEHLSVGDEGRFQELLAEAEARLRDGEYFMAERRFTRALRFTPGHPLATAGLGHAQIGAGLFLSASLTLQSLLTHQPEMIDAAYDPALLPNPLRLDRAVETIRQRLASGRDEALYGFLLAYLGHQMSQRPLIEEGLAAMDASSPDDELLALLKTVWLAEQQDDTPEP